MRVDAHHHIWRVARADYGWLTPALAPIYRDFTLADLRPLLVAHGISATVLVQAAPTVAETEFLLTAANESDGLVRGVVGWVDGASADAVAEVTRLARDPLLRSVRPMLHDLPDPDWISRADVQPLLLALPRLGLCLDALVKPPQLAALLRTIQQHPDLDVVIDHGAKPRIAAREWQPWAEAIAALARHPRVHCKLSGLATEAEAGWTAESLARYAGHLLECFGPGRLLWGSDWPVVELNGSYHRWFTATEMLLRGLTTSEREGILGGNAVTFYGLD